MKRTSILSIIGPGILVAATGVGAGDLATASFTGSELGLAILWAVVLGAFMKFVLNEGLTRWQLATGSTLLEGCVAHLGRPVRWIFLAYLLVWSYFVAAALMSAVGVIWHAVLPITGTDAAAANTDKVIYGILHSIVAVLLVTIGGYTLFEKVMGACIVTMFAVVVTTAAALRPPVGEVFSGLFIPIIPHASGEGLSWTVALLGGIGGTVTVLCYGYWIREEGRRGIEDLPTCRIDLATGYAMTALFGLGMVIVGNSLDELEGGGATLAVEIARKLEATFGRAGPVARVAFLAGAWGAAFSSLLGVWQSVPYLFADLCQLLGGRTQGGAKIDPRSWTYRGYLYAIASLPVVSLVTGNFQALQKLYAIIGAMFIPMLAAVLLALNGRGKWVGQHKNSWATVLVLVGTLVFFVYAGAIEVYATLFPPAAE